MLVNAESKQSLGLGGISQKKEQGWSAQALGPEPPALAPGCLSAFGAGRAPLPGKTYFPHSGRPSGVKACPFHKLPLSNFNSNNQYTKVTYFGAPTLGPTRNPLKKKSLL